VKRFLKWAGIALGSLLVLVVLAGTWFWYAPLPNYDWALNRAFLKVVIDSPETLSQLRMLEQVGIKSHQDDLDDESIAAGDRAMAKMKTIAAELRGFDREDMDYQQQLSYDMADWMLARLEAGADRWRFHNYPVNQLFGVQNGFPTFMESTHAIESVRDAEDYNSRLSKVGVKFSQVLEGLRVREEKGILPPTFVVDKVLEEMNNFVATPVEENILYASFEKKLAEAKIGGSDQSSLLEENRHQIEAAVYPAYQALIDYFTALRSKTTSDDGVWKLPDGDEFYAYMLELFTTSEKTPQQIHETGLAEVGRIHAEMREILAAEGYDVSQPVGVLMRELANEERFLYPDNDEGRAQILADYKAILDEVSAGLDDWFSLKPETGIDVQRIPEFKEKTAPAAYYNGPAMDGSRPGVFYANLYNIKATPRFNMRTLAYHEGVPGHHFQIALAQENKELPLFRRMGPFTAYIEGWALYAERVAWEAGFETDPYDNLGRLQAELFRAVRLVVDTGIHYKRWTREQAIDYMYNNTGITDTDVIAEIERYIVMPGQACAYKVGMMEIMALRQRAEQALGDDFDIREFHEVVLKNGAMPLAILGRVVDQWIASRQSG
jgi:uncharacterized protein (DUF885 family)